MTTEQRLREVLRERAGDVEPTPALQLAVERRISRRRRRRAVSGSLAAAAAVVAAIVVVPGVVDDADRTVGIEQDVGGGPDGSSGTAEDSAGDAGDGGQDTEAGATTQAVPEGETTDAEGDRAPLEGVAGLEAVGYDRLVDGPAVEVAGRQLRLRRDGDATLLFELPAEGESTWQSVAVHPDSTPDDLLVAGVTLAEGMLDLRLLRIVDGEVVSRHVAEPAPRLAGPTSGGAAQARPVFSPDGEAVAVLEAPAEGEQGPVLRVQRVQDALGQPRLAPPERTDLALDGEGWTPQTWRETELGDHQLLLAGVQPPAYAVAVTVLDDGVDVRQSFPLETPDGEASVRASTALGQIAGEAAEWQPSSRPTAEDRAALADVGGLDADPVRLGPTVGELAVLRAGDGVYALGVDAIARWPVPVTDAALLP